MLRTPWLFDSAPTVTRLEVISWWERRVVFYNLVLLGVGIFTWLSVLIAGSAAVKTGVDFEEPIAMIFGPPIYAIMANLCFQFGPLLDAVMFIQRPRVGLFKAGLAFSVFLTALPGIWAIAAWLGTVFTGKKLD